MLKQLIFYADSYISLTPFQSKRRGSHNCLVGNGPLPENTETEILLGDAEGKRYRGIQGI